PERLLTAHYHPIEGAAVGRFLDDSLGFVERAREVVAEHGDLSLAELLAVADARLGPFTSMPNELATTLRALGKETAWSSAWSAGPGSKGRSGPRRASAGRRRSASTPTTSSRTRSTSTTRRAR